MSTAIPLYGFGGGSGGSGGTLTVTAPADVTVTVSKDGKSYTKTADSSGTAVFKGLKTGTWTVTITDGAQTAAQQVTVNADYGCTITFFAATINITYPAGAICTAADGVTTLTAPDTSGTWACVVGNTGTWTVTAADGEQTSSVDVDVTEETAYSAYLSFGLQIVRDGTLCQDFSVVSPMAVTQADGYVLFAGTATGYGAAYTEVDTSDYDTMVVEGTFDPETGTNNKYYRLCIWDVSTASPSYSNSKAYCNLGADEQTHTLDLSSLSGKYYVGITSVYIREQKIANWRLE